MGSGIRADEQSERRCVCGHLRRAHEHLRRGLDCSLCSPGRCTSFLAADSPRGLLVAKLRAWRRQAPPPGARRQRVVPVAGLAGLGRGR